MSVSRIVAIRRSVLKKVCIVALFAVVSFRFAPVIAAADENQDFETWPPTTSWETTMHEGWTLSDGQVKPSRGGFGPPMDIQCAWLHDFDDSANAWLESPLYPAGVMSVSLWTRRDTLSGGSSTAVLQTSGNQVDWVDFEAFAVTNINWIALTFTVDTFSPTYLRIRKTGDTAANTYMGLDDIEVMPRAPVFFTNLRHSPSGPTLEETVDVLVDAAIQQSLNGVVISTFYRFESDDPFTELPMALDAGITYKTTSPIPFGAGWDRTVEYYVQAAFELGGPQLAFSPAAGSNAPAFYAPTVVVAETPPRQLNPSSQRTPFIISEIMYHPADTPDTNSLEFIEVFNTDPLPRDISGFRISGDADYTFPPGTLIGSRAFFVVARNPGAVQQAYGVGQVYGPYTGNLPNNGGTVRFRNDFGAVLLEVTYDDQMPWLVAADGSGHSLVLARPDFGEGFVRAWDASAYIGGSPGRTDPLPIDALRNVVINEFLAHTDLPDVDYIELYNRGTQAADISGCALSDTLTTKKFMVPPSTVLQPGGHIVFDQTNQLDFSLSSGGDDIYLWSPDCSNVVDAVRFDAQVNGVASGRLPDGAARFHALDAQTPGAANATAQLLIDDIVINEIMFAPMSGKMRDEYVELHNRGSNAVDLSYWRFVDGIDFLFLAGTVIPANGYLVIAEDAQHLRTNYAQLNVANTIGDYTGMLSDGGERIALAKPDDIGLPFQDLVIVDEVTYGDGDRWGKWTEGGGSSLELVDPRSDNRLAMNWQGSDETGKSAWTAIEYSGPLEQGSPNTPTGHPWDLQVFIPHAGECLVDDVDVFRTDGGSTNNRILDPGFDTGLSGWMPLGTHVESAFNADEGFNNPGCLHVRASGSGTARGLGFFHNSAESNYVNKRFNGWGNPGEVFTVRAKARWLAGWPVCVLGMEGFWHEASSVLVVPTDLGSPGLQNSRFADNTGPAVSELGHAPVLPAVGQAVTVTCRAHDPDGLASLALNYRVDPSTSYLPVAMHDDGSGGDALAGDGLYSAQIPGQAGGVIAAFHVKATDSHAAPAMSWFPSDELAREALVRFGEPQPSGLFGTYVCWVSSTNVTTWVNRPSRGNHLLDMTFVYGQHRAIYNAGIRYRGNGRGYPDYRDAAYACGVPKSDRFLGINEFRIDTIAESHHTSLVTEQHAYWTAREVGAAASQMSYIRTRVNGSDLVRQLFQTASRDFCRSWYGDDDPVVHENVHGDPFVEYVRDDGMKAKARYRFEAQKKKTKTPSDSFETLYNIIDAWQTVDDEVFDARMAALIDPYGWAAYPAINRVVGNADSYGWTIFHNMFFYASPTHRSRLHLHDMDQAYDTNHWNNPDPPLFPQFVLPMILTRLFNDRPLFRRAYWRVLKNLSEGPLRPEVHVPELLGWYDALFTNGIAAAHPQPVIDFIADRQAKVTSEMWVAPFEITSNSGNDFSTANSILTLDGSAPIEVASFRVNGRDQRLTYPTESTWRAQIGITNGPNDLIVEGIDREGNLVAGDAITVTLTTAAPSPANQLIISEIMYHPSVPQAEYIEICNRSGSTFDLGGWRLNGVDLVFDGGSLIGPGQYRIAVENITAYQHAYGNAEYVIGDYAGNLDNGGETLSLQMPMGSNVWVTIDEVFYDDDPPWSSAADGTGAALQLIDRNKDNNRAGNWGVVPFPVASSRTPGAANGNAATLFTFPLLWINEVMPSNTVTVADNFGEFEPWIELYNGDIATIDLSNYRLSNDYQDLARWAFPAGTTIAAGSRLLLWADDEINETDGGAIHTDFRLNSASGSVILARQWLGAPVVIDYLDYNSVGVDTSYGSFPEGDPFSRVIFQTPTPSSANSPTSAPVHVVVNEWMSDNETTIIDPSDGKYEDWFELYNPSVVDADLNGFTLTDNLAVTNKFTVPAGTIVPAGGFLLVWADNEPDQNGPGIDLHVNFNLSRHGDAIGLYAPAGVLIDATVFGPQGDDQSHGHWPDGVPAIYDMSPSTPRGSNSVCVGFEIDMSGTSNDVYQVEANDNLLGTNWILLDIYTTVNGVLKFTDTNAIAMPSRFYRLIEDL